jgi:hypothetical protein
MKYESATLVYIVTRLQVGRPENWGSFPGRAGNLSLCYWVHAPLVPPILVSNRHLGLPCRESNADSPVRGNSLYRLSYLIHNKPEIKIC